jgi:beta-fructofuranosidase
MNDPNGVVFVGDRIHVFYQLNPVAPHWGRMHWGHAISDDLVTWRHEPIALSPSDVGPDSAGCWSGCVVDLGDRARMFYTGVRTEGEERRAAICQATSVDGLQTWTRGADMVRVATPPDGIEPDAFRDPFVYHDAAGWCMLVGAGTTEGVGAVLLYRSADLDDWAYVGRFLSSDELAPTDGADGPCWECPQLLHFDDAVVLIVSVVDRTPGVRPSHVAAFVGHLDRDRFVVDRAEELGMGPDFYAPATTVSPDGRHLLLGWIPEDPPHDEADRTWTGSLTFPRVVSIGDDGQLSLALAAEVTALRTEPRSLDEMCLEATAPPWRYEFVGEHIEIVATVDPGTAGEISFEFVDDDDLGPEARIAYRPAERWLSVARRGIVSVAGRSAQNARILPASADGPLVLRLVLDGSVLEIEAGGRAMATLRLSTTQARRRALTIYPRDGRCRLLSVETWVLAEPAGAVSAGTSEG